MVDSDQAALWIAEARDGSRLAVSKLLALHHPVLRSRAEVRMSASLKATLEPEDILQQVYLQVYREVANFEPRDSNSFLNWVFTILDHKLVDAHRAAHRQVRDIARNLPLDGGKSINSYWNLLDQLKGGVTSPSHLARRDEALGALCACLTDISNEHREVIQLRFLDGLPVAEVAARLDKSEAAVVAQTKRALESLRKSMDRMGEFTHGV